MTPPARPPCGGARPAPPVVAPVRARASAGRRRPACLSAAWADPPVGSRRERRRAVCSWSAGYGYGTLSERDECPLVPLHDQEAASNKKKGKVADQTALLDPRASRPVTAAAPVPSPPQPRRSRVESLFAMPGIRAVLGGRRRPADPSGGSDRADSPLVASRRGGTAPEIVAAPLAGVRPAASLASLRKCETALALTGYLRSSSSSSSIEPLRPVNRLRAATLASTSRTCSRCSSLLTLASGSRYSLNSSAGGGFVPAPPPAVLCKLCLVEVPRGGLWRISDCGCAFCTECMKAYVEFEIGEGSYDISCPDAHCPSQGVLQQEEIKRLAGSDLLEKHNMYRLNREIELDQRRTWCPRVGCETVCAVRGASAPQKRSPQAVHCPTCARDFCSECKLEWHEGAPCARPSGIPFDSEAIKCCPMCDVPIEKDEGCAQMMCKRCKHVFCWYCLASLDDDFLLRHYDKGPCKNKLGHSRASVIWHRTQVIGIFAGFGILLLIASPLLLLAAPCIVCCKCRLCNGSNAKLDNEDPQADE